MGGDRRRGREVLSGKYGASRCNQWELCGVVILYREGWQRGSSQIILGFFVYTVTVDSTLLRTRTGINDYGNGNGSLLLEWDGMRLFTACPLTSGHESFHDNQTMCAPEVGIIITNMHIIIISITINHIKMHNKLKSSISVLRHLLSR